MGGWKQRDVSPCRHPELLFQWEAIRHLEPDEPDGQGLRPADLERAGNDTAKPKWERGGDSSRRRCGSAPQPPSKRLISTIFIFLEMQSLIEDHIIKRYII